MYGHTRTQTLQSLLIFDQYAKHRSPSIVHLRMPTMFEAEDVFDEAIKETKETVPIPSLRRSWRRLYGAALGIDAAAPLTIENARFDAQRARGENGRAEDKGDDAGEGRRPKAVVLMHRGRVVDVFDA